MGDSWDPDRVVNDGRRLIKACAHLVTVAEGPKPIVMFTHFSVYRFLISNPASWEDTLPMYHVYPLPDAFRAIASICSKFLSINNSPEPWGLIESVIKGWRDHADILDETALLSLMFKGSLLADPRPANPFLVFPCATHLEAKNCTFVACSQNIYNVFTSMDSDSWFGGVTFRDVFPKVLHATFHNCIFVAMGSSHMNLYDGPVVQAQLSFSSNSHLQATRVTMEGYTFFCARNSWNIFPNVGVFRNERTSSEDVSVLADLKKVDVYDSKFYRNSEFCVFLHDSITYNFGL